MVIKGLYNSSNLLTKLEFDVLFFINEQNWKDKIGEFCKHKYLIYFLFKSPEIETNIRKYLLQTDLFSKNDKNKFPIYSHVLRIFINKKCNNISRENYK